MKFACQDLFFSRSRGTGPGSSLLPKSPPGGRGALESAFKMAAKNPEQRGTVMDELVETKVQEPTERQFSEEVQAYFHFVNLYEREYFRYSSLYARMCQSHKISPPLISVYILACVRLWAFLCLLY